MKTTDQNRVNMLNAVLNTLNDDKYQAVWQDHAAFGEGVTALSESLAAVDEQMEIAQGNPGARDAKEQARLALRKSASEIVGATRAWAAVNADPELAALVDYSESTITAGKAGEVVARCRSIHAAATEELEALAKYGVTSAKLSTFRKSIEAYNNLKSAPRQGRVTKSASARLLPELVRSAMGIVRDQLDGLMLQFREVNPNLYEEYFAARSVVDIRGTRTAIAAGKVTPLPLPNDSTLAKRLETSSCLWAAFAV